MDGAHTRDMNTTQRITKTAKTLGLTVSTERQQLVARDAAGNARMSATIVDGKFQGGYITDRTGHVVSCSTVRDMVRFAA